MLKGLAMVRWFGLALSLTVVCHAYGETIPVGSGNDHAIVAVQFGDGAAFQFDVAFTDTGGFTGIDALDVIENAGIGLLTVQQVFSFGTLIDGITFQGHSNIGFGGGENFWHYWERSGLETDWVPSGQGASSRVLTDGELDGWVYGSSASLAVPEPATWAILVCGVALLRRRGRHAISKRSAHPQLGSALVMLMVAGGVVLSWSTTTYASEFATMVVRSTGYSTTPGVHTDPAAVLGKPTTQFLDPFSSLPNVDTFSKSMVLGSFNTDPAGQPIITKVNAGQEIVVAFDHDVVDDPGNPFGLDLIVFSNAFFPLLNGGFVSADSDMENVLIKGKPATVPLPMTVTVSVSPDDVNWYTYSSGPLDDGLFPTQAFAWDRGQHDWGNELDFTKPVDPSLTGADFAGLSVADAIDQLYDGSGGGAGFDLAESGFSFIRFVKVTGIDGGVIDGFADVASVPEPVSIGLLATGISAMLLRRPQRRITRTTTHGYASL